jgi:hypothetical protein
MPIALRAGHTAHTRPPPSDPALPQRQHPRSLTNLPESPRFEMRPFDSDRRLGQTSRSQARFWSSGTGRLLSVRHWRASAARPGLDDLAVGVRRQVAYRCVVAKFSCPGSAWTSYSGTPSCTSHDAACSASPAAGRPGSCAWRPRRTAGRTGAARTRHQRRALSCRTAGWPATPRCLAGERYRHAAQALPREHN